MGKIYHGGHGGKREELTRRRWVAEGAEGRGRGLGIRSEEFNHGGHGGSRRKEGRANAEALGWTLPH